MTCRHSRVQIVMTLTLIAVHSGQADTARSQETETLVFVDAPRIEAPLRGIQDQRLVVESDGRSVAFDLDRIVCWGSPRSHALGQQLVSRNGDILVGDLNSIAVSEIELAHELFGVLKLNRSVVAGLVFRSPTDILDRDRLLRRIADSKDRQNSVNLTNGDELDGNIAGGSPGQSLTTVHIGTSNTPTDIRNIVAATFDVAKPAGQDKTIWIGLRDGSRLAVRSIKQMATRTELHLQDEVVVSADTQEFIKQVVWVQPPAKRFFYLAQLPSAGYRHLPFFAATFELGVNHNALGGTLRCSGREYANGLGMHSAARVAYDLGQRYRWFEADIAIDDVAGGAGAVTFRVYVEPKTTDRKSSWQQAYESSVIRGGTRPVPIRVDISNAARMALVVDFAERADECDYANWLNARVLP